MNAAAFYLSYAIIWVITFLPLRILYIFSGLLYFFLYHFPGYRRKVVYDNLKNSFPQKSEEEIRRIQKKFYRHLSDLCIEILKLTHMSRNELRKRMIFENPELLRDLYNEKRNIAGVLGHYNNWEWLNLITELSGYTFICVYKPIKNKQFEEFLNGLRIKHGVVLSPMSMVIRDLIQFRNNGILTLSAYLTDQTPAKDDIHYWTSFLGQDTPVYLGAGKIASKYDMALIFFNVMKIRRGYYRVRMELLADHAGKLTEEQITEIHVRRLEEIIMEKPEYWIWSHRRWKHKKENIDD
jgi:Kdo2-lipid IVA lauroyltransferase/acyltransferase